MSVARVRPVVNIVDRPLSRGRGEVSLSAFSFLFCEIVHYAQGRSAQVNINDLERRLSDIGYSVGSRMLDLLVYRDKSTRRELRLVGMLSFVQTSVWKALFGKPADSLERSIEHEDEYMIVEQAPLVNKYVSLPKELAGLNCAAYVGGIVKGILDGADFTTQRVTAHTVGPEGRAAARTVILIKFRTDVIEREAQRE